MARSKLGAGTRETEVRMDGVKVALGNRGMTVELPLPFLLGPLSFQTTLPCSGGYHLERGGMSLHAVGINCKKRATEYKGADVKYMG